MSVGNPVEIEAPLNVKRCGGTGPAIVLLHGFGSDSLSWLLNQPALEAVGEVYVVDLPGHGSAGADVGDGEIATLAARVAAAVAHAGLQSSHWVGHSLGGAVALLVARSRPELVSSLSLIAPAGLGRGVARDFLDAYPRLSSAAEAQALLARLVKEPRLIGRPLVARVLEQLARPGAREALHAVANGITRAEPELRAAAQAVAAAGLPRLVVWGEDDTINPPDLERLASFGGETVIVPSTGHLPHVEAPKAVNLALARFIRQGS